MHWTNDPIPPIPCFVPSHPPLCYLPFRTPKLHALCSVCTRSAHRHLPLSAPFIGTCQWFLLPLLRRMGGKRGGVEGNGYEKRVTEDESVTLLGCEQYLSACSLHRWSALLSRIALCPPPKDEDLQAKRRYRQSVPRNVAFRKMRICKQRGGTVNLFRAMSPSER